MKETVAKTRSIPRDRIRARLSNNYAVRITIWTLFLSVAGIWTFYLLFGHPIINALYTSKARWIADTLMQGKATTPVESYYRGTERLLWEITWSIFVLLSLLAALIKKPLRTLTSLMAAAIFLTIGELAVRVFLRDITTTSDNSSYFARRWRQMSAKTVGGFANGNLVPKRRPASIESPSSAIRSPTGKESQRKTASPIYWNDRSPVQADSGRMKY